MWWHMPVIPATWEVEIRQITVRDQLGQKKLVKPLPLNK
jgi:hypothetical protein